jgi:disulfide bond formation protein DsbB
MTMNTWETPRRLWLVLAITVSIASVVGGHSAEDTA